jgi:hypothetical protein
MSLESRTSGLLSQFFDAAQAHFSEFQLVAIQGVKSVASVAFPEADKRLSPDVGHPAVEVQKTGISTYARPSAEPVAIFILRCQLRAHSDENWPCKWDSKLSLGM